MIEEIGRIAVKVAGREAGRKCVIIDILDKNFVLVTGPKELTGIRRRKANIAHLAFTPYKIGIQRNAGDDDVMRVLEKAELIDYMKQKVKVEPKAIIS